MDRNSSTERTPLTSLSESFERYLQDKGKGRGGDGAGTIDVTLHASSSGSRSGPPATAATTTGPGSSRRRRPKADLRRSRRTRVPGSTPGISVEIGDSSRTRYKPTTAISPRGVAGVSTRAISRRITRSGRSAMAPLPEDDGRKPGDQQAWTSEQRHAFTRYVDERAATPSRRTRHSRRKLTPRQAASALCGAEGGS